MKSTVLLVLTCAVATTLASPEQLLVSEVIGVLTFRLRESRPRRDLENKNNETSDVETTPKIREPPWCFCGTENFLQTSVKKHQDIANTCVKEYVPLVQENGNGIVEKKSTFTSTISLSLCNTECTFKKLNFLTSEGKLDKSAIKTYFMDNILVEDWMQNIAGKAVDQCLNSGSSFPIIEGIILDIAKDLKTCNSEPYKFSICLLLEMAKDCPEEQKSKDSRCRLLQLSLDILKKVDKVEQ